jgi:pimeloyl-ACP methyl ester carboxylesterase
MRRALRALTVSLLCAVPWPALGAPAPAAAVLTLTPCELEHPLHLSVVAAMCGVLSVAENPDEPAGRRIGLQVAKVPAVSRAGSADALFVLAGGPGQAAGAFYASLAGAFGRIHRDRDIVLVDQRGTGKSNPLECPEEADWREAASPAQVTASAQRCLEGLRTHARAAFYTTSVAVRDLEAVRAALGYARIDLYGVSYGTRVAQQYLRRYPQHVRAVILDGVVPPELAIGPQVALDAESALHRILTRCVSEKGCRERFGDPSRDYEALRVKLAQHAVAVTLPDPAAGEPRLVEFGHDEFATVLRLGAYSADYAALLPLLLHTAATKADFAPLAAQFLLLTRSYETLATGMHNSVVCTEDVPFWENRALDRAASAATFMGAAAIDALIALCRVWPHGPIDADLHQPLHASAPALLLSGGDDPVTPPAYARQAARGFSQVLQLELPGFGHGQLTAPCMDRVLAQFLRLGSTTDLDTSCTRNARPLPFFTSVNGPPP